MATLNADLTDSSYVCPSVDTFTTNCKDAKGQIAYCIVKPTDDSCELISDCRPTVSDPTYSSITCDSMYAAQVDSVPASTTSLNLGFNALKEFKPTYTNGTSKLIDLRMVFNFFEDMDDIELPASIQSVDVSRNYLRALKFSRGFSSVIKLAVSHNPITSVSGNALGLADLEAKNISLATLSDLKLPSTVMNLDVSGNPNMTFNNFTSPSDLRTFVAIDSKITTLETLDFSPSSSLGTIDLSGNTISSIVGVEFPPKLRSLNLNGSDISCFLVRESDVSTLTGLSTFIVSSISQDGCDSAVMNGTRPQPLTIADKSYDFSVIGDAEFTSRYFPHKVETTPPPLPAPTPAKSSSTTIIIVVVVVVVVLLAGIGFFFYRRRRSRFHKSMTYWNLSTPTPQTGTTTGTTASSGSIGMPVNDIRHDPELVKRRVPQSSIKRSRVLAKGGFGIVYLATFNDREVVAKQILPEKAKDSHAISRFMDEIRLWAKLNHPNIVQFLGLSWTTLADVTVVTEYMSNGDLAVMLRSQAAVSRHRELFTWTKSAGQIKRNKLELAIDIAEALVYLHGQSPSIIHRDLKSQNVLLNESCVAKVTDFGISREVEDYMTAEIGTVAWIAPEILDGGQYTERADIYSFGVVLSELDTCEKPYASGIHTPTGEFIAKVPNAHIALAVSDGSLRPSFDNDCPRAIRAIAQRCLKGNPRDRPTAMEVLAELCALQGKL
ncbi:hypothetical protein Poli38472_014340 [Pythium oligandrum]|uniref:Protein kinase domain-containing protein n=1 Tax=Pythium oligandrum TaxID=41045 RepID=A0A8K1FFK0_PYTOL|nr:hypothetical protein Poli38472_014340 [Pythium oligandrum]|eukprot:TMW57737.1 hypothetical protein Poli38472_014340 [Pythium oligandrum]